MVQRIDVTASDGVRLAAWEFRDSAAGPEAGAGGADPSGAGPGSGLGPGPGVGPGVGDGSGPGLGAGPGSGPEPGVGPGSGVRPGPGAGPGSGLGAGPGSGPEPGAGSGSGSGAGPGVGDGSAADGSAVLLLHGLMGHAFHWSSTARWLGERHRVVALDQRGHGRSDRPPAGPYTRDAFVADAETVVEQLGLAPVTLIGHSMGALTAWQLAARRPDLVSALVICDMRASALGEASQQEWEDWFRHWPLPFPTQDAARRWFGEDDPRVERPDPARGAFFAEVMHEAPDGWRPRFSRRQMLTARETWVHDAHWEELAQVRCPTLVVRGLDGELGRAEAQEMVRVLPAGQYAEIPEAGHYLHYDHPTAWRAALEPFLTATTAAAP